MTTHSGSLDLSAIAHQAMIDAGFEPDLPQSISAELQSIQANDQSRSSDTSARDLRGLLWSSIDNSQSRDLDQVEYVETLPGGDVRLRIGIADVDGMVHIGSAIDGHASANGTSVYTGFKTFSMLPEELSEDRTSLVGGADRSSIVIDMVVSNHGVLKESDVYLARLHNYAKLSYDEVGAWLDEEANIPPGISGVPGMEAQIRLQLTTAMQLRELRRLNGALELETIQAMPVLSKTGQVTGLAVTKRNSARDIIENFMIAANVSMAHFLEARRVVSLRRVVRTPEQWPRIVEIAQALGEPLPDTPDSRALADFLTHRHAADPTHFPDLSLSIVKLLGPGEYAVQKPDAPADGHFGLAVHDYLHSTAPNRRYADLVTQRLAKAALGNVPSPYAEEELDKIAAHCTEREDAARKVERKMRKVGAAVLLESRVGEEFDAIVTGVTPKGTFARLIRPPVDGRVMRGEHGLRVGERIRVKLLATDPRRGFIDFGHIGGAWQGD